MSVIYPRFTCVLLNSLSAIKMLYVYARIISAVKSGEYWRAALSDSRMFYSYACAGGSRTRARVEFRIVRICNNLEGTTAP